MDRGAWIDPKRADIALAAWVETFMAMSVSLSPTTIETYRRDLDKYVLPAFGSRRLGQLRSEDIGLAVAEAMSPRYRAMIYLALDSGMRWSELVGLRRSQVDLLRRKVRVTEQLVELSDRTRLRKEPKTTAGVRSITISKLTAGMLAAHLEVFGRADPDSLVFTTAAGTPISHSSFQTHHFKPALKAAGVEARFHDLRHTSVALAIAAGAHPKAIQVRMGHSSITVTLDRYGHLFPELDEAIADAFNEGWRAARVAAGMVA